VLEIVADRAKGVVRQHPRQQLGDGPHQRLGLERAGGLVDPPQRFVHHPFEQGVGKGKMRIRPHRQALGEFQREPTLHPRPLHHDALALEDMGERPLHDLDQGVEQFLGAVAAMQMHEWRSGSRSGLKVEG